MRHFLARISAANRVSEYSLRVAYVQTSSVVSSRCRRLPSLSLVCVESSVEHKEDFRGLAAAIASALGADQTRVVHLLSEE